MICPKCIKGRVTYKVTRHFGHARPPLTYDQISQCPDCQGSGIVHCCEGENVDVAFVPDEALIRAINSDDVDES